MDQQEYEINVGGCGYFKFCLPQRVMASSKEEAKRLVEAMWDSSKISVDFGDLDADINDVEFWG